MTIDVTGNYVVGPSDTVTNTTDYNAFYMQSLGSGSPDPTLTIEGTVCSARIQ